MRKQASTSSSLRRQAGATLIEALISMLIFALGMLGIAGLMGAAVKYQGGNVARMSVAAAVDDISERLRVNVATANGYTSISPGTGTAVVGTGYLYSQDYSTQATASTPTYAKDCVAAACTQVERADYDLVEWRKLLRSTLPGGAGIISGSVNAGMDVTVMWFDKDAVQGDDASFSDALQSNELCTNAQAAGSPAARFCCPNAAAAPPGVRCYNAKIIP